MSKCTNISYPAKLIIKSAKDQCLLLDVASRDHINVGDDNFIRFQVKGHYNANAPRK
jgi:hypothetical protein